MPKFASAIDTQRIPVRGLVPESAASAPSNPVVGQIWTDTSVTPRLVRVWDGAAWVALNIYSGTAAGSYAAGDDTRITGAAQKSANLSDLANAASARTNLGLGTAALTNTGTGAANTILGNDARLTDQRVPTDASVTGGTAGAGVKLAANTITDANVAAANKDGVAGSLSLRTLGTGAQQALAGNTRLDQITAAGAALDLNGQRIINVAAPIANTDVARLADVQSAAAGIDAKPSARAATTANIALSGTQTIDGVALVAGDRVVVKDQTVGSENGIYVVAAGAWARSSDVITPNSFLFVEDGTSNGDTQWVVTNNGTITPGTTAIVWTQFGGATAYTGTANRISVSGTSIDIASNYVGQTSLITLGTVTTGTWNGTAVGLGFGGTGATSAAAARTNLNVSQRGYAADLSALTAGTPLVVTHNLGTQDVITEVRETATQAVVEVDVVNASATTVSVRADVAYAAGALRIVVIPVA